MRIHVDDYGLGDHLAVTAFVREFKHRWPQELITIASQRHQYIWENNPNINWGREEILGNVKPDFKKNPDLGNMPRQMCMNLGFIPDDTRPEIFLADTEKGFGPLALRGLPRPIVALDYHATASERRWPLERFQEVVRLLRGQGISTAEIGGNPPKLSTDRALSLGLHVRQTAAILAECDLYIGNDSGSFHLAASVGTPQVVLFGPTHSRSFAYESTTPLDNFWQVFPENVLEKVKEVLACA
jgi:ADP-heptose:LPS heptosyltransferase